MQNGGERGEGGRRRATVLAKLGGICKRCKAALVLDRCNVGAKGRSVLGSLRKRTHRSRVYLRERKDRLTADERSARICMLLLQLLRHLHTRNIVDPAPRRMPHAAHRARLDASRGACQYRDGCDSCNDGLTGATLCERPSTTRRRVIVNSHVLRKVCVAHFAAPVIRTQRAPTEHVMVPRRRAHIAAQRVTAHTVRH